MSVIGRAAGYNRQDVIRILHLQPRQLWAWEREGLIATRDAYSFEEMGRLRKLRDLTSRRVSAKAIRASVDAMQRVAGMRDALMEATAVRRGSRLSFRHAGTLVDPVTQQLAFDFEGSNGALHVVDPAQPDQARLAAELQEMFLSAVRQEENPANTSKAIEAYKAILARKPDHAPSLINLGTIHYGRREYGEAERLYRRATLADPDYALAFFDLGNVLDEMQRLEEATAAYQRAVELVPQYADAHYNLALAYERRGEKRLALRHWLRYVKLDPAGPWSTHARGQARKILGMEKLRIVARRSGMVLAG